MNASVPFGPDVLRIDCGAVADEIAAWLRRTIVTDLRRRGAVVAVSGGVDSAVCLALTCQAIGAKNVRGLYLPGPGSSDDSAVQARKLCEQLDVPLHEQSIMPALAALGCSQQTDAALAQVFPELPPGTPHKIVIAGGLLEHERGNLFDLVVAPPSGGQLRQRLPLAAYLQLTAATNMQQRLRKLCEYTCAEQHNYAVIGTPNRLEYDLGFFVRGGDGLADVKPIAHLYKSQVYDLARHLDVPESIWSQPASTETYSLPQTQEEFFFAMPLSDLDLLLWAHHHDVPDHQVAAVMELSDEQVAVVRRDIVAKARAAARLHHQPHRMEVAQ